MSSGCRDGILGDKTIPKRHACSHALPASHAVAAAAPAAAAPAAVAAVVDVQVSPLGDR